MKIRKATKKDHKRIAELMKNEYGKPPYKEKWTIKAAVKSIKHCLKVGEMFVAVVGGKVIGFILLRYEYYNIGKVTCIEELVVDSKYQGKGIGKALIKKAEKVCKSKKIWIIAAKNALAFKIYQKLGYKYCKDTAVLGKKLR